jgi:heme-degrading monooxygenase HmoA
MSVVVIARFPVSDVAAGFASLTKNGALLEEISEDSKKLGAIHHTFAAGENELIVIDEWDSAESFRGFFNGNPKKRKLDCAELRGTAAGVQVSGRAYKVRSARRQGERENWLSPVEASRREFG